MMRFWFVFFCGAVATLSAASQPAVPPPGRLIDLGGYRLHLYCTGAAASGRPTIVLSAGGGDFAVDWALVQPAVSESFRVCSYDRAGAGWSDAGPEPRTLRQESGELRLLLAAAHEAPPYVLVGHSLGGLVVRLFQLEKPDDVAGMLLVDPAHEDGRFGYRGQLVRVRTLTTGRPVPPLHTLSQNPPVLLTGDDLNRCLASGAAQIYGPFAKLPVKDQELRLWAQRHPKCVAPGDDYLADEFAAIHAERAQHPQPLGATPLTILMAGRTEAPPGVASDEWRLERSDQMNDLSRLSSRGRVVRDDRARHHVHLDDPAAVIDAIRELALKAAPILVTRAQHQ